MRQTDKKDGLKGIDFIHHFDRSLTNPGLYEVDIIGGGCMLMKTDIFRKIPQPYFWIDGIVGTDVHLCNQLREAGVKIFVDTSIELGHQGDGEVITSRTIPKYSRVLGQVNERLWEDLKARYAMNDIQLESEVIKASSGTSRADEWNKVPRETWESVRDYYVQGGDWQILNMAAYNLKYDQARDWAINDIDRTVKPGSTVVDVGCGIGYTSIAIAERNKMNVISMDIEGTPTLEFLRWRIKKHSLEDKVKVVGFYNPIPDDLKEPADLILMISVFDHLWDPKGMLEWLTRNTKQNGYLLCDTWRNIKKHDEPQHIIKYDPHRIIHDFRKLGWRECAENPFLFRKEF
jgi:2-polyprenyl-3-methyl-5-hydroxy-6-metoxy-1,4-benzoquinol methylase